MYISELVKCIVICLAGLFLLMHGMLRYSDRKCAISIGDTGQLTPSYAAVCLI